MCSLVDSEASRRCGGAERKPERGERPGQIRRRRRAKEERFAGPRVEELELAGVEGLPAQLRDQLVGESTVGRRQAQGLFGRAAVRRVADDGMSTMAQMNADLVRAAGFEGNVEQRETR